MAHHTPKAAIADSTIPPAMDYAEHERTYKGFLAFTKWSIIACAILVVFLFFAINP